MNAAVLSKLTEYTLNKNSKIIQDLKKITPQLSDIELLNIYNKSISIHQSRLQNYGDFLENTLLVDILDANLIDYKKQVTINSDGIISGFNLKKQKCYHIVDFVVGKGISIGDSITKYKVISCKTTCRERWTQDDWSFNFPPVLYILLTLSPDYPNSDRFRESETRKIITSTPKQKDNRIFKLNFDHIISELNKTN
jgi:hypothetical protein